MKKIDYRFISDINVTSLVDVTLVLLIIFMITAPLLRSGIEVNLPKTVSEDLKTQRGIVVTMSKEGDLFLNEEKVALKDFETKLLQKYSSANWKSVLIEADFEVRYGDVVKIMDKIKNVGISNLGLLVEPEKK